MIVFFYALYVWLTPVNWNWLWFFIAVVMNIWQTLRRPYIESAIEKAFEQAEDNGPNWKGPY